VVDGKVGQGKHNLLEDRLVVHNREPMDSQVQLHNQGAGHNLAGQDILEVALD
jgi:hypothetical protein